jgi:hypothetical protein
MRKTQAGASEASPAWAAREANPLPSQTRQRSRHRHNSLCDCRPEVCGPRGLVFFSRAAAQCNHIMPLFSPPHAHPQPDERGKCRRSKHRDGIAAGNPAQDRNAVGTNGDDCPARSSHRGIGLDARLPIRCAAAQGGRHRGVQTGKPVSSAGSTDLIARQVRLLPCHSRPIGADAVRRSSLRGLAHRKRPA